MTRVCAYIVHTQLEQMAIGEHKEKAVCAHLLKDVGEMYTVNLPPFDLIVLAKYKGT